MSRQCVLYKRVPTHAEQPDYVWVLRFVDTLEMIGQMFKTEADARMYALLHGLDIIAPTHGWAAGVDVNL